MIEQGLKMLIQAGLGDPPIAPGGFAVQLPKDLITEAVPMAWAYRSINDEQEPYLGAPSSNDGGFAEWELQIDCHGRTMSDAIVLAKAIRTVLRRFSGALSDPEKIFVQSIFRRGPALDGYNDASRTYVRSLEYLIHYNQV